MKFAVNVNKNRLLLIEASDENNAIQLAVAQYRANRQQIHELTVAYLEEIRWNAIFVACQKAIMKDR